ncbi:hypothetical protein J6590_083016 [Homalodisca vitripennis]|nr:hypothetical protein J6590_083016 [Homalodisca vitripennis]
MLGYPLRMYHNEHEEQQWPSQSLTQSCVSSPTSLRLGDILTYILGYPLRISHNEHEEQQTVAIAVAHTILRFFTNFAKTG